MKVLLVHNYYGSESPSGENKVFQEERALLLRKGHQVSEFVRHSDTLRSSGLRGMVRGALSTPWNPWAAAALGRQVDDFRPDVIHVHNTFPLISPSIFRAIGQGAARVLTVHNFRLFCPAAIPMRDGRICVECIDRRSAWRAVQYKCYRDSMMATLPLALSVELHRRLGTWARHVDAFITLSEFQRNLMIEAGLPARLVHVKPNFYQGDPSPVRWDERGDYVVFVGRLTPEKGVDTLVQAWLNWQGKPPELRVLGDGPSRQELERLAASVPDGKIQFFGQVPFEDALRNVSRARLLILPSRWYETFGMVVCEAFACGTPVAVSNLGPLPSLVEHGVSGVVFEAGNVDSLLTEVKRVWESPGLLEKLSKGARASFEAAYTAETNYHQLMEIYAQAINTNRGRE